jgi:uncharacterized protein (TIGR02145 family)
MKQFYLLVTLVLLTNINLIQAQNDSIYFWKTGKTIFKISVKPTDLDSITFKGPEVLPSTVTDIDGNVIQTVIICNQTWTKTNLNVTKYRNGDVIPQVTDPAEWDNLTTGAWCYYNNDPAMEAIYGKLYNWYAVSDPRGLAPTGYHIPTDTDWAVLITCLGGESIAGSAMKETGNTHWLNGNTEATNSSGFTALPGGAGGSRFEGVGFGGLWWTSSEGSFTTSAWSYVLVYSDGSATRDGTSKSSGFSVRCIKD